MARAAAPLPLTPEQRRILEAWRDASQTPRPGGFPSSPHTWLNWAERGWEH